MGYTCQKCGSEVKIKIIKQTRVVKNHLRCPLCGGKLLPLSIGDAVLGV